MGVLCIAALACAGGDSAGTVDVAAGGGAGSIAVLASGAQCGWAGPGPRARWVEDQAGLAALVARRARDRMGGPVEVHPPAVDFTRERVLMIEMGEQPTAGFALAVHPRGLEAQGRVARLHVRWIEPAPGTLQAQVITHPCLVVRVPRLAAARWEIVDQDGQVRLALDAD